MYKKRWYDGLHDIYEDKNEFEIKFGCFGGDGGGSKSGPKKDPKPPADPTPTPDDGFRGEQSAARPSAAEAAVAAAAAGLGSGYGPGTKTKEQLSREIQGKVADAVAASQREPVNLDTSMQNMTMDEALGLSVPTVSEQLGKKAALPGTTVAPAVKSFQDYVNELTATSPQAKAAADYAKTYGNTGIYSETLGYGQTNPTAQTTNQISPSFSVGVPPGTSMQNPGLQLNFSTPIGPQTSVTPDVTRSGIMSALGVPGSYQTAAVAPTTVTSPINDPTAQAGIGSFFTETIPGVFGFSTPAKAKSKSSKAKSAADRFKGTKVRTKPVGVGEYFTNLFTG